MTQYTCITLDLTKTTALKEISLQKAARVRIMDLFVGRILSFLPAQTRAAITNIETGSDGVTRVYTDGGAVTLQHLLTSGRYAVQHLRNPSLMELTPLTLGTVKELLTQTSTWTVKYGSGAKTIKTLPKVWELYT